jgi:hypothetical protein
MQATPILFYVHFTRVHRKVELPVQLAPLGATQASPPPVNEDGMCCAEEKVLGGCVGG